MTDSSPKWKKPSDIMKIHRKKKRQSLRNPQSIEKITNIFQDCTSTVVNGNCSKRRNPFSQCSQIDSPSKRQRTLNKGDQIDTKDNNSNPFFNILESIEKKNGMNTSQSEARVDTPRPKFSMDEEDSKSHFDFIERFVSASQKVKEQKQPPAPLVTSKTKEEEEVSKQQIPVDWSLKVKFRVVSQNALGWCSQLKTADEAKGVTQFVKGASRQTEMVLDAVEDKKSIFQSCCMYWIYPNLPWLRLFPRIVPDSKISVPSAGLLQEDIQAALQNDWLDSFTSTYHQLRAQQCPYFYVCTHQFTVLFRCASISGQPYINAFLTPTTRGFREALKQEGISFSMPVLEKRKKGVDAEEKSASMDDNAVTNQSESNKNVPASSTVNTFDDEEDDDEFIDTDEGASVWLESIGLDKKQFPSLDPNKVKLQREGFKVIDNRPESLVYVEGSDVQGLFNFLLNCRSCVASSGPQAGVPPTILSPTAFKGATLKSHKIKHSTVKQTDNEGNIKQVNILEVNGPCLPHHVHNLTALLQKTQNQDFSMTFNTYEPSVPFNSSVNTGNSKKELSNTERIPFGMDSETFDPFFHQIPITDRLACMRELYCNDKGFSWNT